MVGLSTHVLVDAGIGRHVNDAYPHTSAFGSLMNFQRLSASFAHSGSLSTSGQVPGFFKWIFQACRKNVARWQVWWQEWWVFSHGRPSGRQGCLRAGRWWAGGADSQHPAMVYPSLSAWGLLEHCLKFRYLIFFFYFCSDISGLERRPKLLLESWGWKWGREWRGKWWQGERKRESGGEKRGKGEKEGKIEGGSEGGWDGWKEGEGWGKPSPDLKPRAVPSRLELCAFAQVMLSARCPFTLWGTTVSY